jgi:glycosyltransferase involved in cell wall biosynthesis
VRIVFDCRSVFEGMGGIGRATACLARQLPAALPEHEVVLLFGARRPAGTFVTGANVQEVNAESAMIDPEFEQVRLPGLLEELGASVYHGTCFATPIARGETKLVATIHDVVFKRHPELVDEGLRAYLDRWTRVSCATADALVTVSNFSRGEILELYECRREVDVVPNAVDERFFGAARARAAAPYVLYVGSIEAKKNILPLLRGFAALVRAHPEVKHDLVLVGGAGGARFDLPAALASEPSIAGRVRALGHVSDAHLERLYAGADAFAYLSEYEGFGLPPLEAMAAGVPTLVSDRSSLPEVTGGGALVVDPHDAEAVGSALFSLLEGDGTDLVSRGREAARRFSWEASARQLAAIYERVVAPAPFKVLVGGAR